MNKYELNCTDSDATPAWAALCEEYTPGNQDSGRVRYTALVSDANVEAFEAALYIDDDVLEYERHDNRLERAQMALAAAGFDCSSASTESTLYVAVSDESTDEEEDPSANATLEEIRSIVAEFGATADWTGNGNTDSNGSSTSDISITISN